MTATDPDRWVRYETPGAHEWWYFDALSDDGRDALVLVWYSALPFDPDYGVATLRHLRDPGRFPQPNGLDHCAIGVSWHRDGKLRAYALNRFRRDDFEHAAGETLRIRAATNVMERDERGYRLRIDTPAVDGRRRIRADLRFQPALGTTPHERLISGSAEDRPHLWILAAPDCRVEGRIYIGRDDQPESASSSLFSGRGYHDHNAGAEDLTQAVRRWRWGRFHHREMTYIYYESEPQRGEGKSVWIECRDAEPVRIVSGSRLTLERLRFTTLGMRYAQRLRVPEGIGGWSWSHRDLLDWGPFYLRWVSELRSASDPSVRALGICEHLDTKSLHRPWFNWMIPYRLKRPSQG